jgi:hypothetical protein
MGNGVWDDIIYDDPKVEADSSMASHRVKDGILEDGYNKRWQILRHLSRLQGRERSEFYY